jgi:ACT domain-containing protein
METKIEQIFSKIDKKYPDQKGFLRENITSQAIERTMLEVFGLLEEEKYQDFMQFLRKGASRSEIYTYMESVYPETEEILLKKAGEIIDEFEIEINKK